MGGQALQVREFPGHALVLVEQAALLIPALLQILQSLGQSVEIAGQGLRIFLLEGGVGRLHLHLVHDLLRTAEKGGIGVGERERTQALNSLHQLNGVLRLEFLIQNAGRDHVVKLLQGPGDGEQLHGDNRHSVSSFRLGMASPLTRP